MSVTLTTALTVPDDLELKTGNGDDTLKAIVENIYARQAQLKTAVEARENPLLFTRRTVNLTDLDGAAATGTALMVAPRDITAGPFGVFYSASANTADESFENVGNTAQCPVQYDANPASNQEAVQVYFDEDGADGAKLLCVSPIAGDLHVPMSDGRMLTIKHSAGAAAAGVAVYFDDDAVDKTARLLFVSPTNASGTVKTSGTAATFDALAAALAS